MAGERTDLDELTEAERAAVLEGETDDASDVDPDASATQELKDAASAEDKAAAEAAKVKTGAEPEADAAAKAKAEEEAAAAKAAEEATAKAKAEAEAGGKGTAEEIVKVAPGTAVPKWVAPADADEKLADIAAREADLAEKFDNGDINAKEHLTALKGLQKEERQILKQVDRAEMAHDMRVAKFTDELVPGFLAAHPVYESNETLFGVLDAEVRRLQVEAGKEGKDPFSPTILEQAHKALTDALLGLGGAKPAGDADAAAKAAAAAPKGGKEALKVAEREPPPTTLAKVPAAAVTETDGGVFSRLDKLAEDDPNAYQDLLATMPKEQRERYYATAN